MIGIPALGTVFDDRFRPPSRPFGRLRAHSSRCHVQKPFASHPQIAQRKQRHQVARVLDQTPVLDLHKAKLALDDPKRVLYLGSDAGLGLLKLLQHSAHRRVLVQHPTLARHHGHVPFHLGMLGLNFPSLLNTPIARVGKDICFLAMQQCVSLRDVVRVGRRGGHAVHQARFGVSAYVRLHPVVPLVAFLGLVHLRVACARAVLGGARCRNQRGIHHGALLEQQALGTERGVDGSQDLQAQVIGFEQVAEAKNGALIGQMVFPYVQAGELTKHRCVVQSLFHCRVGQVEPLLQEVDAQHRLHGKRRASAFGSRRWRVRGDQRNQFGPWHHQVHLVEELALARPLGLALETTLAQAHLFHGFNIALPVPAGRFCRRSLNHVELMLAALVLRDNIQRCKNICEPNSQIKER